MKWLTLAKAQMDHGRWGFWPRVSCAARCWLCVAGGSPAPTCERECWLQNVPREDRWKELVGLYLSPEHCDHPDTGCPVAALPPEIARAKLSVRKRVAAVMKGRMDRWVEFMPGFTVTERQRNFFVIFSSMAGAISVARLLTEPADRQKVLASMRDHLFAQLL